MATHIGDFAAQIIEAKGPQPVGVIWSAFRNAGNDLSKADAVEELKTDKRFALTDDETLSVAPAEEPKP